jgi:hypothetical protein
MSNEAAPQRALLPSNPYRRSPIKRLEDLAGRSHERKTIGYYLKLTASGGNPHLALIGQRGVGKTSLLNGAEAIAKELGLLTVRLDMNELKAGSVGRFWQDLYQTLALAMVKAGCWGGQQGTIYAELLRMINSRQPGDLEKAVMQVPYLFSCHQGAIEEFECPDALVVSDFEVCLRELNGKGLVGIAFLIDEADCLGKNVPLLQMFRNIFQVVEHCTLLLAGTDAVFPALSEVFSPIPRQFYRMDVRPFARWSDTMELVVGPLRDRRDLIPEVSVLLELHDLCGGAPDEVQLYCHHMYRSVEDGASTRMALSPVVFREVLREYRSNTPANVDAVLNAIERLPDRLLFESKWLSRRRLTRNENLQVCLIARELELDRPLNTDEEERLVSEVDDGYRELHEAGITEVADMIRLAGAPLTAGFWKSYVEVERGQRWSWNDESFSENLRREIVGAIGKACDSSAGVFGALESAGEALLAFRRGESISNLKEVWGDLTLAGVMALDDSAAYAIDVLLVIDGPPGRQSALMRLFERPGIEVTRQSIEDWISAHAQLLASRQVAMSVDSFSRWGLPTGDEVTRLGRIAGVAVPDVFGPSQGARAVEKFTSGDVAGAAECFSRMLVDKEESAIRNNLGFCQIILGQYSAAIANLEGALVADYAPLYELNKGVAECLSGDRDAAIRSMTGAWNRISESDSKFDPTDAAYVLVLEGPPWRVRFQGGAGIDAAILFNLWKLGALTRDELESRMGDLYPADPSGVLNALTAGESGTQALPETPTSLRVE